MKNHSVESINENPVRPMQNDSEINITLPLSGYAVIELVNESGITVKKNIIDNSDAAVINTSGLQPGIYILVISSEHERTIKKITIK